MEYISKASHKHINNNHKKLKFSQIKELKEIDDTLELLPIDEYANIINYKDEENLPALISNKIDAVVLNITVGYAANAVPKGLLQGIKLLMTENYNIRNNI